MSDFVPNKLGFDVNGYKGEFNECLNIALNQLSFKVQDLMKREIMTNGNGSGVMRQTAAQQVHELSRKIDGNEVELIIGIDEDSLGGFSSQTFVRTAVVLHGNITSGPLMAVPNKMAWDKNVTNYRVSDRVKTAYMLPKGMTQHEKVGGFGAKSQMLDNIFEKQINHVISDFYERLDDLMMSIDYSKYITGG